MPEQLITIQEASSLLGVTSTTLRNWDKNGRLTPIRNPLNKYRMYRLREVIELQNQLGIFPITNILAEFSKSQQEHKPLTESEVRRLIKALHRIVRDFEGNSSLIERFDELTKIMYCKIADERSKNSKKIFCQTDQESDKQLAIKVRNFFLQLVKESPVNFPKRFSKINLSDAAIKKIVDTLSPLSLSGANSDLKGLAYEQIIENTFEKGDNQQFFTPRTIIEFMVKMLEWPLGENICDPACGTGGFLLYVSEHLKHLGFMEKECPKILGFEIDERLAWVSSINLEMHGISRFEIQHINGTGSLGKEVLKYKNKIGCIITNPPFGSDLSDRESLSLFELGKNRSSRRRGVLFIERCLDLLKPGGVLAIIIDDSVLNGPSNGDTRRLILEQTQPLAIVSLPNTAFMPYASVKASILFLQKQGQKLTNHLSRHGTFFAQAEMIGRKPNGDPLLRLNKASGAMELDSDLPEILKIWSEGKNSYKTPQIGRQTFWAKFPQITESSFAKEGFRLDPAYHHPSRKDAANALKESAYPLKSILELCEIRNEVVVPSKDLEDEELTYVGLANIETYNGMCAPTLVNGSTLKSAVKRFVAGDILFAKLRPDLRKVCLIPNEISEGFASAECLVLVPKTDARGNPLILPELLAVLLRSDLVYGQLIHLIVGIGRPRLNKVAILNVRIPTPPFAEQKRLMALYYASQASAKRLIFESQKFLDDAEKMHVQSRQHLFHNLLSPVNDKILV